MSPRLLPARECGGKVDAAEISATRALGVSRNFASRASARLLPTPASTRPASRTYLLVICDFGPSGAQITSKYVREAGLVEAGVGNSLALRGGCCRPRPRHDPL